MPILKNFNLGRRKMQQRKNDAASNAEQDFVITRVFDARRDVVWKAWTDREQLMQWFGPKGFTMPHAKLDLRPGGEFHYALRSESGQEMWGKWTFREIAAPEKLVLISSFSDAQGGIARHPMSVGWPLVTLSTTKFEEHEGKTTLTIRWSPWNATELEMKTFAAAHSGMKQGWSGTFAQLTAYLART
jgi:uncharacterized protein YndB with AHSA1/START domain